MNSTPAWLTVTLREVETKVRDKAFIISTLITVLLIIGSIVVTSFLANRTANYSVAGGDELSLAVLYQAQQDQPDDVDLSVQNIDAGRARTDLADGKLTAVLSAGADGGFVIQGREEVPGKLTGLLDAAAQQVLTTRMLESAGINPEQLPGTDLVSVELLEGDAERNSMIQAMAFIFSFLFYMAALIFGMPIANSVIEEKQNRVVEILASAIRLRDLLAGKILGNIILALGQLLVFLGVGLGAAWLSPVQIPFLGVVFQVATWFVVFFLAGFLVLAGFWAALGALAARTEDLQQSSGPVVTLLIAILFVGIYAKGTVLVIASYVPIVSSVAMPIRLLTGTVPWWEPVLSLLIVLGFCWLVLVFAERIYRRAVMHTGGALTLRKALKLED
ncbi:ABC transporter permease [Glutamicibacter sp. MNS18]|uniref:ABC transporter permease n=1 Tax=Glutamicibacter sp. MNS18 TaxID=2989817 RepID=UPI00223642FF|nr:ABC transporter permease [Glutamicibacter sp. MNS18]MCW4467071.1 ABC transporter permease [Glutamicibacter sp. MNS18]